MNFFLYFMMWAFLGLVIQGIIHFRLVKWFNIPEYLDKDRCSWSSYKYVFLVMGDMFLSTVVTILIVLHYDPDYFWACMIIWMPMVWNTGICLLMLIFRHNVFNDEVGNVPVENFYNDPRPVYVSYTELLVKHVSHTIPGYFVMNFLVASPPEWNFPIKSKMIMITICFMISLPMLFPDKFGKLIGKDLRGDGTAIYSIILFLNVITPFILLFVFM